MSYAIFGLIMLSLTPGTLITYATTFYTIALGFSYWHTLAINVCCHRHCGRTGWCELA